MYFLKLEVWFSLCVKQQCVIDYLIVKLYINMILKINGNYIFLNTVLQIKHTVGSKL